MKRENEIELIVLWALTGGAVAIMLLRLGLRQFRQQELLLSEYLTVAAIVSILLRGAVVHVAILWGTNIIGNRANSKSKFTPQYIYRHEVGAKLTIVNRALYTVYTWLQKCVIMCVLQHLLKGLKPERLARFYWATLILTFIFAFIVTFTECHPFELYWQVVPDPGSCAKGVVQLEVFSSLNIATDLMLIALPLPTLIKIKRPFMERIRLVSLFLVGLTIVAVTLNRLLVNLVVFHRSGQSHNVANVEIFFAAFVANAPTIYGLLNIGSKRARARTQYLADSCIGPRPSISMGNDISKSRDSESSQQQSTNSLPKNTWIGNSVYQHESDEEMMIEMESARASAT